MRPQIAGSDPQILRLLEESAAFEKREHSPALGRSLVTPSQSTNLLPGTMRPLVVEVAREAGLDARGEVVSLARLAKADEVFISSTSQLVMPVVELDGRAVGSGTAGPLAIDLARRVRQRFELPD